MWRDAGSSTHRCGAAPNPFHFINCTNMDIGVRIHSSAKTVKFLQVTALGQTLALEKSKVRSVKQIDVSDQATDHIPGLTMLYKNSPVPLVDFRSAKASKNFLGEAVVIVEILNRPVAIMVDVVVDTTEIPLSELSIGKWDESQKHGLVGSIFRPTNNSFVVDLDIMMGPVVSKIILHR